MHLAMTRLLTTLALVLVPMAGLGVGSATKALANGGLDLVFAIIVIHYSGDIVQDVAAAEEIGHIEDAAIRVECWIRILRTVPIVQLDTQRKIVCQRLSSFYRTWLESRGWLELALSS